MSEKKLKNIEPLTENEKAKDIFDRKPCFDPYHTRTDDICLDCHRPTPWFPEWAGRMEDKEKELATAKARLADSERKHKERDLSEENLRKTIGYWWPKLGYSKFNEAVYPALGDSRAKEAPVLKELESAKAENGRLVEAKKKIMNRVYQYTAMAMATEGGCKAAELIEDESIEYDALSSSNALDYWQGEIRKAKIEAYQDMRFFCHTERSQLKEPRLGESVPVYEAARYGAMGELAKKCEDAIVYQSNQSKGEKSSQDGGIDWTPEKRKQYEKIVAEYREALRPLWEAAERSTKISGEDMNMIVRSDTNPQSKVEKGGS